MWKGGGQGYSDMVAVTLGTGVGGGVIIGGRVVSGSNGQAVKSDIFIWMMKKKISADVRTKVVWNSMHLQQEL